MIDFFFTAAIILLVIVTFGWDYIKAIAVAVWTWARSKSTWGMNVLMWSAPKPGAAGSLFTFYGVEVGNYFVGAITSRVATVQMPEPSRIVVPS